MKLRKDANLFRQSVIFLSAWQSRQALVHNLAGTAEMKRWLDKQHYNYEIIKEVHKGKKKMTFAVNVPFDSDILDITNLARGFDQDFILYINIDTPNFARLKNLKENIPLLEFKWEKKQAKPATGDYYKIRGEYYKLK